VCVIDSGVDNTHPDLSANYLGGYDFVNGDTLPFDDRGHGTHVAGSVLALDDNTGVVGVAPQATLLAYKILDGDGQGFIADAIAALEACYHAGGRVTNSSFGTQTDPGPSVKTAYDNAEALGIVNVAAAGNRTSFFGTCSSIAFPARYSSVIAVTATTSSDAIANTSCRGPEAELAAPGANIYSTVPTGACAYCTSSGYNTLSGTSMASPHVAGVAALVIATGIADANGNERINDEVRQRLQATADDLGTSGRDSNYGYGLVDADEAAPAAPPDPPGAPSGLIASAFSSSQINLTWTDASTNETGFKIERCAGTAPCSSFTQIATVGAGATTFSNTGLAASSTYTYRVRAYNAGGDSAYSNHADATTFDAPPAPALTLSATGYKRQGVQYADLAWTGATSTNVDIFRNTVRILTTSNDGVHTDNINTKGGGSYTYKVCEAGTTTCSNEVTVRF
jgi:subtilisin